MDVSNTVPSLLRAKVGMIIPVIQMGNQGSKTVGNVSKNTELVSGELGFSVQIYLCSNLLVNPIKYYSLCKGKERIRES